MPDDDESGEHPHHIFFQVGSSPEAQEAYRLAMEQQELIRTDGSHEVIRFFTELSAEQMMQAKKVMSYIAAAGDSAQLMANFYSGLLGGLLQSSGVCLYCLVNHDDELQKIIDEHPPEVQP